MNQIKISKNYDWWTTEIKEENCTITKGGSDTLVKELFRNILEQKATEYMHNVSRLNKDDQEEVFRRLDVFIEETQKHMKYVFDNFYKKVNIK